MRYSWAMASRHLITCSNTVGRTSCKNTTSKHVQLHVHDTCTCMSRKCRSTLPWVHYVQCVSEVWFQLQFREKTTLYMLHVPMTVASTYTWACTRYKWHYTHINEHTQTTNTRSCTVEPPYQKKSQDKNNNVGIQIWHKLIPQVAKGSQTCTSPSR